MEVTQKQKTFTEFFSAFLKSSENFEHFQKKMTLIDEVFPKLRTPKNKVRSMSIKPRFKGFLGKQHGERTQILLKFAWQLHYHIYGSL